MRQAIVMLVLVGFIGTLAACSGPAAESAAVTSTTAAPETTQGVPSGEEPVISAAENTAAGEEILIAYFSVPETDGVDTVSSASRVVVEGEVLGNSQYVAQLIQQQVGGDLFRIQTVQEYPGSHDALLDFAYEERAEEARPVLQTHVENPGQYQVIFLGFPCWNSDLPMPLYSFLEEYDFSGKTIIPFTTHGGSGFARTIGTIQELQPGAIVVEEGLSISRNNVPDAAAAVADWAAGLDL